LDKIPTLEGQAQFVGQWAADLYSIKTKYYLTGNPYPGYRIALKNRIGRMAKIIRNSGYNAQGVNDALSWVEQEGGTR